MSLVPGLSPNIRLQAPAANDPGSSDVVVEHADEGGDTQHFDDAGALLKIEHDDGSITISLDGSPLAAAPGQEDDRGWYANLAERIPEAELSGIADDLLRSIDDDIRSREEWIQTRAEGLKLLGLMFEQQASGQTDAPVEGTSNVRHPLLLEAVLRFQANSRSEMLPTDGPVKVKNDDNNPTPQEDSLADVLEKDINHYLTTVATEYYPDTDRMFLMLGFGGTTFKKVYKCPLRNRPVSETVDADDLIVNSNATDLRNAMRVTHRVEMRPSVVRRLQLMEVYRDIELGQPNAPKKDDLKRQKQDQQGITDSQDPLDRNREIYECYCELDIPGYEHKFKGEKSGLEVPYRVTIDVSSRQILSIVRNYPEPEGNQLPQAVMRFVKYTFVPGFGFYDIGLLHILGNTTRAVTAAWRELLDAGMFANFPGFLIAKSGARQTTNILRVPPGAGATVDTGGMKIGDAVSPLPYQQPSMAMMQLVENVVETGQRVGGTAELQVGEGRAEMPVGTTMALIEQAVKVLNAVHKRMHASQAEEFRLLMQVFKEHPESFWQSGTASAQPWDEQTFLQALQDNNFSPQADPNTASHAQRLMKIMALKQLQQAQPSLYDPIAVDTAALRAIGWADPKEFFAPPQDAANPPPELMAEKAKIEAEGTKAQATMITAQSKSKEVDAKIAQGAFAPKAESPQTPEQPPQDTQADMMGAQAKLIDAETRRHQVGLQAADTQIEDENRDLDRQSREKVQVMELVRDIIMHPDEQPQKAAGQAKKVEKKVGLGGAGSSGGPKKGGGKKKS